MKHSRSNSMPRRLLAASLLVLAALAGAATAETPIPDVLPARTPILVYYEDLPATREAWEASPLKRLWDDPEITRFLAPLREQMEVEKWEEITREHTGYSLSEILAQFDGQLALIFPPDFFEFLDELDEEGENPSGEIAGEDPEGDDPESFDWSGPFAIMASMGDDAELFETLFGLMLEEERESLGPGEQIRESEEEFEGETLHLRERISAEGTETLEGWALVDGMAIMAGQPEILRELVSRWKAGTAPGNLGASESFRSIRERHGGQDALVYIDFTPLYEMMHDALLEESAQQAGGSPQPFPPERILEAMALDAIESFYLCSSELPGESRMHVGMNYAADVGLIKAIACVPGPCPRLPFLSKDLLSFSIARFSLNEMYVAIMEILAEANPDMALGIEMQLQQLNNATGIDFKGELLGSFGDVVFSTSQAPMASSPGSSPPFADMDQVFGLAVTDRQSLEMTLGTLLAILGQGGELFETMEYLGATIQLFKMPIPDEREGAAPKQFSYTITDGYFLMGIGSSGALQPVLAAMQHERGSIWEDPEVAAIMDRVPREASVIAYTNMERTLEYFYEILLGLRGTEHDLGEYVDFEHLPPLETFSGFFGPAVSYTVKGERALVTTQRALHAE